MPDIPQSSLDLLDATICMVCRKKRIRVPSRQQVDMMLTALEVIKELAEKNKEASKKTI